MRDVEVQSNTVRFSVYYDDSQAGRRRTGRATPWKYDETGDDGRRRQTRFETHKAGVAFGDAGGFGSSPDRADNAEVTREAADRAAGDLRWKRTKPRKQAYRSPIVKDYVLNRANGVCECPCGKPFDYDPKFMHGHHARRRDECAPLGIKWDSRQNVMAIRPDCHVTLVVEDNRRALWPVMDEIAARDH